MYYEQKEVRNDILGEGQGLGPSEETESRANDVAENLNNRPGGAIQVHNRRQIPEQESVGHVIRWERFLPRRSLKVLLVENDDSTRQVVSALLRNCSYEVIAVANGLQAWKILEDLTNHIDLVLTEVVMPFLSGVGLLCKIMSHKTLKNIPVIMTSSHDSMGIVFKCLSKGAVDFLVKPIRKNELKNLWQHIWRRCHSSSGSGSGSESGTHTKKSVRSNSNDESDNNSGSSGEHDTRSNGLDNWDGSDNGSGNQSSWTKRAAEVESPQPVSPWDQLADAPDSTCAQVIHIKPETFSNRRLHVTETKECQEQDEQLVLDNVVMGKGLDIKVSGHADIRLEFQHEKLTTHPTEIDSKPFDREVKPDSENLSSKLRDQAPNEGSAIANSTNPQAESRVIEGPSGLSDISQANKKASCDSGELPSLELTLKRLSGVGDVEATAHDDRNILRHSDLSAFSKYNNASSANQGSMRNVGSCSPPDNSSVAMKMETTHNFPPHSNDIPPNQQSKGISNDSDPASSKSIPPKQEALHDRSESMSAFKCFHSSAFEPVQSGRICSSQLLIPEKADDVRIDTIKAQQRNSQHQVQVQHHHHYYHHYHHHIHNVQQQLQPDHGDVLLKNMAETAPQCESSNVFGESTEGNAGNYSVNGSASGSNHGSNGQNGSSTGLNAGPTNIGSDNGAAGNSGTGDLGGRINGNGADEDRIAQREAALTKFRQKRKDRCFEKKVRYQSRKKLADQRPRIRGQFVRQEMFDTREQNDNQGNKLVSDGNSRDTAR